MTQFYDAERILFPLLNSKKFVSMRELINYAHKVESACGNRVKFDISPASIENALKLYPRKVSWQNGYGFTVEDEFVEQDIQGIFFK